MSKAITDDVIIAVRIASFYPLNSEARQDIAKNISKAMVDLGHKYNFIVYKASMESKKEINNDD